MVDRIFESEKHEVLYRYWFEGGPHPDAIKSAPNRLERTVTDAKTTKRSRIYYVFGNHAYPADGSYGRTGKC